MSIQLRVIIEENNIRKLTLPSGIPNKVEDLVSEIIETFQIHGEFGLLYEDKDFGNQFFTLHSTSDLEDKGTVKLVRKEPLITLDLHPVDESGLSSTPSTLETHPVDDGEEYSSIADDVEPSNSQDTILLPESCRSAPWPVQFQVPTFSRDIELILAEANKSYHASGTHFQDASIKSAIMQDLAKAVFSYTAYPSSMQISSVAEALLEGFPCLKEPGTFAGTYGWQQRLKYKMHNFRAKLKSQKYTYPELEVNTLKRKRPTDAAPAKNVKRPKKAEVNYLPPHPVGENEDTLEKVRLELVDETKKKNNAKVIEEKMSKTFSIRRLEVVTTSPAVSVLRERWPGLFSKAQIKEEFRRITTVSLEETFMLNLDGYTPRLLQLMRAKGGAFGTKMHPLLSTVNEFQSIEKKRDACICCLIEYLGENQEELFQDCQEDELEGHTNEIMKLVVIHNPAVEEDPADVCVVIEGIKVLNGCGNRTTACILLMGLIYALNLEYPKKMYTKVHL
ncbi:uncharacterized protein LOC127981440 [Carassius gibelio]|uniref:uncharacterized protein LOC127981440 n=1 Tax=Carassius gibelio TaxID=101364 RepID=UPI0022795B93|nr:uncharacterized protein LOC127981440 [Carassius gibelio]